MATSRQRTLLPTIAVLVFGLGIFFVFGLGNIPILNPDQAPITEKKELNQHVATPDVVKGVYLTSSSAGSEKKINWLINLKSSSELNAVVVDIKDFSGYVAYDSEVPEAEQYKTERIDIEDIDALVEKLHESGIYVIARMTVFQDPALVRARPDWAVKNKYTGRPWTDNKGLSWIDPANHEAWIYYSAIAKDTLSRGFDEINFDYIRFPSDGNMEALVFPSWNTTISRPRILSQFYKFMRSELGNAKMSADLFGFVTTRTEDFGVGQVMEDAFEYFDYVSPMVYPSHYPSNFLGFENPAEHPYEVVLHALKSARERLIAFEEKTGKKSNIRPWIQDFKLGAAYTPEMVQAEIKAAQDALGNRYNGFTLWNAGNNYTESVLK